MAEWSFQRQLISGVVLICLLAIGTSVGALVASRVLVAPSTASSADGVADLASVRAIELAGARSDADVRAWMLGGGPALAESARAESSRLYGLLEALRARTPDPRDRSLLDGVWATERARAGEVEGALAAGRRAGGGAGAALAEVVRTGGARRDSLLGLLAARFESARLGGLAASRAAVSRVETALVAITIATVVLLALLCLLLIAVLNRSYHVQAAARSDAEHGRSEARTTLTQVEAASHLKDEFLANVSHELRNPLAPILTWTQLLRSGTLDAAKTRRALEVIERNVTSQAQLIDDLVDVSRIVSGRLRLDVRPIDLAAVIRQAADSQGPASDAKQIRLQLVLDERAGHVSGDSERLQQVMGNLISNAIKFTPRGGRVQVVLQRSGSHVQVTVSDSGMGIDAALLPHIFEPFRQGTAGPMRRHGGLGLGLSIVHHIVELHGGEIAARSDGSDLGATFTLQFPLLATTPTAGEPPRWRPVARDPVSQVRPGRLDGIRVLVVDDEPSASEALLVLFSTCGADARGAGTTPEALDLFESWRPDILVSDIAMPAQDGYALIRAIRQHPPQEGGGIPAVALTAYAKIEDRVKILGAGFQMYLSKPADPSELVAVVSRLARDRGPARASVAPA